LENEINPKSNRRDFINFVIGAGVLGWLASMIYPITKYIIPPKTPEAKISSVKIGKLEDIKPNTGSIFKFGNKPGIIVRTEEGEVRAFSATCTHLDCTVQFQSESKLIWCACHNGKYDLTGKNISGPPPKPLDAFKVVVKGGEVFVTKEA
jgi:cytochrome b6-f complex iron-sulfur subunit